MLLTLAYIKRRKKNGSVYLYLYESYRDENGKVKSRYLDYLGVESEVEKVALPKKSLKKITPLVPRTSKRAGDVKLLFEIANRTGIPQAIDSITSGKENCDGMTAGKLLTCMAINHLTDPLSASQLDNWIGGTLLP